MKNYSEEEGTFNIQLVAGNNAVLVEANDYDSEIFVPQVINGRIALVNAIRNRRCCQSKAVDIQTANNSDDNSDKDYTSDNVSPKSFSFSPQEEEVQNAEINSITMGSPLACSTPLKENDSRHHCRITKNRHPLQQLAAATKNVIPKRNNENLPSTPEIVRKATRITDVNSTSLHLLNYTNYVPLSSSQIRNENITPTKNFTMADENVKDCLIRTPLNLIHTPSPPPSPVLPLLTVQAVPQHKVRSDTVSHNKNKNKMKVESSECNVDDIINDCLKLSQTAKSECNVETNGRKVITPLRTYARKPIKKASPRREVSVFTNKVTPSYMINPTKGIKGTYSTEVRRRKLIIDQKICITPEKYKINKRILRNRHSKQYYISLFKNVRKMTAFEMLTNSNRYEQHKAMSKKLQHQFRKSCVTKASSTNAHYKALCMNIPPLSGLNE